MYSASIRRGSGTVIGRRPPFALAMMTKRPRSITERTSSPRCPWAIARKITTTVKNVIWQFGGLWRQCWRLSKYDFTISLSSLRPFRKCVLTWKRITGSLSAVFCTLKSLIGSEQSNWQRSQNLNISTKDHRFSIPIALGYVFSIASMDSVQNFNNYCWLLRVDLNSSLDFAVWKVWHFRVTNSSIYHSDSTKSAMANSFVQKSLNPVGYTPRYEQSHKKVVSNVLAIVFARCDLNHFPFKIIPTNSMALWVTQWCI